MEARWNYASRRSVALLRRSVITMLSVISKNLIVAAYIQPGAWVACKVSRAAQGTSVFAGQMLAALVLAAPPDASGSFAALFSGAGVRDAKASAQVPRR